MGSFLAVSAIMDRSPEQLAMAIQEYVSQFGVACGPARAQPQDSVADVLVFPAVGRWTVVLWPEYFTAHDISTCEALSRALDTIVSTLHVYDDDYWTHVLLNRGDAIDRFASIPDYFAETPTEANRLRAQWAGDPELLSSYFQVPAETIRPYLVQLNPEGSGPVGKAFADDEFEIEDFWVMTDFWRRLGIEYPSDVGSPAIRLQLGNDFSNRLPAGENEL